MDMNSSWNSGLAMMPEMPRYEAERTGIIQTLVVEEIRAMKLSVVEE